MKTSNIWIGLIVILTILIIFICPRALFIIIAGAIAVSAMTAKESKTVGGKESDICSTDFFIDPEYNDAERKAIIAISENPNPPCPMWLDTFDSPVTYRADKNRKFRPSLHAGQRKLFITELRFLTDALESVDQMATIVYAGAAPGLHTPLLCKLFPGVTFHLYDPAEFGIKQSDHIKLTRDFFTDETAKAWADKCDLFISDIRLDPNDKRKIWSPAFEKQVADDMKMQSDWVQIIRPRVSMLKFRPPYGAGTVTYLAGRVMTQAWAPHTSTESRLIVTRPDDGKFPTKTYDHGKYENTLYYINNIIREWAYYPHDVTAKGIDHCYDCMHEIKAWEAYLAKAKKKDGVGRMMDMLTKHTPNKLLSDRSAHGHSPGTPMCKKRKELYEKYSYAWR